MSENRKEVIGELSSEIRASQNFSDVMDDAAAEILGVNRTDLRCLDILDRSGPMTAGALADAAGITTGAITGVLDRLEATGYARRVADPEDRRRVLVEFTPKARRAAKRIYGPMAEIFASIVADYSTEELARMRDLFRGAGEMGAKHLESIQALAKRPGQ
jgi:DNA-binding MarR family transcriptional regulator